MRRLAALAIILCGCGGGGSGDEDAPAFSVSQNLSGVYRFDVTAPSTDCRDVVLPPTVEVNVQQNGGAITAFDGGYAYTGIASASDAFVATASGDDTCKGENGADLPNSVSHYEVTLSLTGFDGVTGDMRIVAQLGDCSNDNIDTGCQVALVGMATRVR